MTAEDLVDGLEKATYYNKKHYGLPSNKGGFLELVCFDEKTHEPVGLASMLLLLRVPNETISKWKRYARRHVRQDSRATLESFWQKVEQYREGK